jgi:hypothetical protein
MKKPVAGRALRVVIPASIRDPWIAGLARNDSYYAAASQ